MTDEEAAAAFRKEQAETQGDAEVLHGYADEFLCTILRSHGFPALALAFEEASVDFWYA